MLFSKIWLSKDKKTYTEISFLIDTFAGLIRAEFSPRDRFQGKYILNIGFKENTINVALNVIYTKSCFDEISSFINKFGYISIIDQLRPLNAIFGDALFANNEFSTHVFWTYVYDNYLLINGNLMKKELRKISTINLSKNNITLNVNIIRLCLQVRFFFILVCFTGEIGDDDNYVKHASVVMQDYKKICDNGARKLAKSNNDNTVQDICGSEENAANLDVSEKITKKQIETKHDSNQTNFLSKKSIKRANEKKMAKNYLASKRAEESIANQKITANKNLAENVIVKDITVNEKIKTKDDLTPEQSKELRDGELKDEIRKNCIPNAAISIKKWENLSEEEKEERYQFIQNIFG